MTLRRPSDAAPPVRCDLRPELAACFLFNRAAPAAGLPAAPVRGVLAELARYGRP